VCSAFNLAKMKKTRLDFSSHTGNLALVRAEVRKFLDGYDFSEKERMLIVLGVDEACTNIIRYAYELRADQPIRLSLEQSRGCIRVRLRDYGEPISNALKDLGSKRVRPGGRGILLIRNAFDKVDYVYKARGTELVLTKNLAPDRNRRGNRN
jgi:serine/threonine-protein kinase RsbW